jgi:hypothetical protein
MKKILRINRIHCPLLALIFLAAIIIIIVGRFNLETAIHLLQPLASFSAIIISALLAVQAFLNNRLAEMYRNFQSATMMDARKVVDSWNILTPAQESNPSENQSETDGKSIEDKLEEIRKGVFLLNLDESTENNIKKYYQVLMFTMFLNEICLAYRTGVVPEQKFLIGFAHNIAGYYKKLKPFIDHRRDIHIYKNNDLNQIDKILYSDFEIVAMSILYKKTMKDKLNTISTNIKAEFDNLEYLEKAESDQPKTP